LRTSVAIAAAALLALLGSPCGGVSAQGVPAPERFVLSGVVVFDGGSGLAWIQEPALTGDRVIAVRPGQSIGPYKLTKIREDRVELEGPGGTIMIPVYGGAGGSGTVVASAPSGAGRAGAVPRVARGAEVLDRGSASLDTVGNPQAEAALAKALMERMDVMRQQAEQQLRNAGQAQRPADPAAAQRPGNAAQAQAQRPSGTRESDAQPVTPPPASGSGMSAAPQNAPAPGSSNAIMLRTGDPLRRQTFQSFIGAN